MLNYTIEVLHDILMELVVGGNQQTIPRFIPLTQNQHHKTTEVNGSTAEPCPIKVAGFILKGLYCPQEGMWGGFLVGRCHEKTNRGNPLMIPPIVLNLWISDVLLPLPHLLRLYFYEQSHLDDLVGCIAYIASGACP